MKLLLLPLFLLGAAAGTYRLGATPDAEREVRASVECPLLGGSECPFPEYPLTECAPSDCHVSVEPASDGTCLVTCLDANDEVLCQEVVTCDEPCEAPCQKPCERAGTAGSCARR